MLPASGSTRLCCSDDITSGDANDRAAPAKQTADSGLAQSGRGTAPVAFIRYGCDCGGAGTEWLLFTIDIYIPVLIVYTSIYVPQHIDTTDIGFLGYNSKMRACRPRTCELN